MAPVGATAPASDLVPMQAPARHLHRWLGGLLVLAICGTWELLGRYVYDPTSLVPFSTVVRYLPTLVTNPDFVTDLRTTLAQLGESLGIGLVAGLFFGWLMSRSAWIDAALEPYVVAMGGFPALVFYPVFVGLLGLGNLPIVLMSVMLAVIPITLATAAAFGQISDVMHKLTRSLRMSRRQAYRLILIPACLPNLVPGIRLGTLFTIIGVISTEFLLGDGGIGYRITLSYELFQMTDMYANILVVVALALIAHILLKLLERVVRRDLS